MPKKAFILCAVFLIIGLLLGIVSASALPDVRFERSSADGSGEPGNSELLALAYETLDVLRDSDYEALADLAHPDYGVVFVPYSTIDLSSNRCFTPAQIAAFGKDETKYVWGLHNGDAVPIELTPAEYFAEFVYNADYRNASYIGVNRVVKTGNSLENLETVFPNCKFVDFCIPGIDPELEGVDWCSLRTVFELRDGEYRLVALIHSQWTL